MAGGLCPLAISCLWKNARLSIMDKVIGNILMKLESALSTILGWVIASCVFVVNFVHDYSMCIMLVVISTALDLMFAIIRVNKMGGFTKSDLMRKTFDKVVVYGMALLLFIFIEKITVVMDGFSVSIIGALIILTEAWSILGSLTILFPDVPFLKVLKYVLRGEMANKLKCDEDKVDDLLKENKTKRKRM